MSDKSVTACQSPPLLRIALGLVYFHFGFLKFFPDLSPAEMLATQTVMRLSIGWLDARTALLVLATFECAIGLGFLFNLKMRWLLVVFLFHMAGTFAPLFVLPELAFKIAPFAPTLEGQYILKNVVFVAAGLSILWPNLARERTARESTASPTAVERSTEATVSRG